MIFRERAHMENFIVVISKTYFSTYNYRTPNMDQNTEQCEFKNLNRKNNIQNKSSGSMV